MRSVAVIRAELAVVSQQLDGPEFVSLSVRGLLNDDATQRAREERLLETLTRLKDDLQDIYMRQIVPFEEGVHSEEERLRHSPFDSLWPTKNRARELAGELESLQKEAERLAKKISGLFQRTGDITAMDKSENVGDLAKSFEETFGRNATSQLQDALMGPALRAPAAAPISTAVPIIFLAIFQIKHLADFIRLQRKKLRQKKLA